MYPVTFLYKKKNGTNKTNRIEWAKDIVPKIRWKRKQIDHTTCSLYTQELLSPKEALTVKLWYWDVNKALKLKESYVTLTTCSMVAKAYKSEQCISMYSI